MWRGGYSSCLKVVCGIVGYALVLLVSLGHYKYHFMLLGL